MKKTRVRIKPDGTLVAIYNDGLVPMLAELRGRGCKPVVARASHVEPAEIGWLVDMSPIGGRIHRVDENGRYFITREAALAFEVRQLEKHHGFNQGGEYVGVES